MFSNPNYSTNNHTIGNLQFPSKDTGYAEASNGSRIILLRTTNGGISWDSLPYILPPGDPKFITSLTAYTEGSNILYRTTNGGMDWQAFPTSVGLDGFLLFPSNDTILTITSGRYARTVDGAKSWNLLFPPNDVTKNGGAFADSKTGYVVGDLTGIAGHPDRLAAGYCQKTTDAGATWGQMYTALPSDLQCCQVLNVNTVVVAGSNRVIGRTTDGGVTWDSLFIGDKHSLYEAVSFCDSLHGLIVGAATTTSGIVLATNDGGNAWQRQYLSNVPWLTGVAMLNDSVAIICGLGNIYRTTTGGNFSSVTNQSYNFQLQVYPNPSSTSVTIQYQLPSVSQVSFNFYDILGNTVGVINSGIQGVGSHQVVFDCSSLANGAYHFSITAGSNKQTGSFTIQR